ncbi:hypothetical protein BESB_073200 [Besnoitia besnoiti]|uniref:GRAM domain-containing protein n=1 Tax=Besnoitia besnoiti TaxID=94643 RepID=A0A2A9M6S3_BESBE|nr:uncharacterized protein BESB_073200 [Besnoitia besnoiti]PFH34168.1 hypothetical protein BESB_073200 [Besnoitia besnoiti]
MSRPSVPVVQPSLSSLLGSSSPASPSSCSASSPTSVCSPSSLASVPPSPCVPRRSPSASAVWLDCENPLQPFLQLLNEQKTASKTLERFCQDLAIAEEDLICALSKAKGIAADSCAPTYFREDARKHLQELDFFQEPPPPEAPVAHAPSSASFASSASFPSSSSFPSASSFSSSSSASLWLASSSAVEGRAERGDEALEEEPGERERHEDESETRQSRSERERARAALSAADASATAVCGAAGAGRGLAPDVGREETPEGGARGTGVAGEGDSSDPSAPRARLLHEASGVERGDSLDASACAADEEATAVSAACSLSGSFPLAACSAPQLGLRAAPPRLARSLSPSRPAASPASTAACPGSEFGWSLLEAHAPCEEVLCRVGRSLFLLVCGRLQQHAEARAAFLSLAKATASQQRLLLAEKARLEQLVPKLTASFRLASTRKARAFSRYAKAVADAEGAVLMRERLKTQNLNSASSAAPASAAASSHVLAASASPFAPLVVSASPPGSRHASAHASGADATEPRSESSPASAVPSARGKSGDGGARVARDRLSHAVVSPLLPQLQRQQQRASLLFQLYIQARREYGAASVATAKAATSLQAVVAHLCAEEQDFIEREFLRKQKATLVGLFRAIARLAAAEEKAERALEAALSEAQKELLPAVTRCLVSESERLAPQVFIRGSAETPPPGIEGEVTRTVGAASQGGDGRSEPAPDAGGKEGCREEDSCLWNGVEKEGEKREEANSGPSQLAERQGPVHLKSDPASAADGRKASGAPESGKDRETTAGEELSSLFADARSFCEPLRSSNRRMQSMLEVVRLVMQAFSSYHKALGAAAGSLPSASLSESPSLVAAAADPRRAASSPEAVPRGARASSAGGGRAEEGAAAASAPTTGAGWPSGRRAEPLLMAGCGSALLQACVAEVAEVCHTLETCCGEYLLCLLSESIAQQRSAIQKLSAAEDDMRRLLSSSRAAKAETLSQIAALAERVGAAETEGAERRSPRKDCDGRSPSARSSADTAPPRADAGTLGGDKERGNRDSGGGVDSPGASDPDTALPASASQPASSAAACLSRSASLELLQALTGNVADQEVIAAGRLKKLMKTICAGEAQRCSLLLLQSKAVHRSSIEAAAGAAAECRAAKQLADRARETRAFLRWLADVFPDVQRGALRRLETYRSERADKGDGADPGSMRSGGRRLESGDAEERHKKKEKKRRRGSRERRDRGDGEKRARSVGEGGKEAGRGEGAGPVESPSCPSLSRRTFSEASVATVPRSPLSCPVELSLGDRGLTRRSRSQVQSGDDLRSDRRRVRDRRRSRKADAPAGDETASSVSLPCAGRSPSPRHSASLRAPSPSSSALSLSPPPSTGERRRNSARGDAGGERGRPPVRALSSSFSAELGSPSPSSSPVFSFCSPLAKSPSSASLRDEKTRDSEDEKDASACREEGLEDASRTTLARPDEEPRGHRGDEGDRQRRREGDKQPSALVAAAARMKRVECAAVWWRDVVQISLPLSPPASSPSSASSSSTSCSTLASGSTCPSERPGTLGGESGPPKANAGAPESGAAAEEKAEREKKTAEDYEKELPVSAVMTLEEGVVKLECAALCDFDGSEFDALTSASSSAATHVPHVPRSRSFFFRRGDIVRVTVPVGPLWEGLDPRGVKGVFPASCVFVPADSVWAARPALQEKDRGTLERLVFDFFSSTRPGLAASAASASVGSGAADTEATAQREEKKGEAGDAKRRQRPALPCFSPRVSRVCPGSRLDTESESTGEFAEEETLSSSEPRRTSSTRAMQPPSFLPKGRLQPQRKKREATDEPGDKAAGDGKRDASACEEVRAGVDAAAAEPGLARSAEEVEDGGAQKAEETLQEQQQEREDDERRKAMYRKGFSESSCDMLKREAAHDGLLPGLAPRFEGDEDADRMLQLSRGERTMSLGVAAGSESLPTGDSATAAAAVASLSSYDRLHQEEFKQRIGLTEFVLQSYSCALSKRILLQGRLYVTQNTLAFFSFFNETTIFGLETVLIMKMKEIVAIRKKVNAFFFDNSIEIELTGDRRHFFATFLNRDKRAFSISSSREFSRGVESEACDTMEEISGVFGARDASVPLPSLFDSGRFASPAASGPTLPRVQAPPASSGDQRGAPVPPEESASEAGAQRRASASPCVFSSRKEVSASRSGSLACASTPPPRRSPFSASPFPSSFVASAATGSALCTREAVALAVRRAAVAVAVARQRRSEVSALSASACFAAAPPPPAAAPGLANEDAAPQRAEQEAAVESGAPASRLLASGLAKVLLPQARLVAEAQPDSCAREEAKMQSEPAGEKLRSRGTPPVDSLWEEGQATARGREEDTVKDPTDDAELRMMRIANRRSPTEGAGEGRSQQIQRESAQEGESEAGFGIDRKGNPSNTGTETTRAQAGEKEETAGLLSFPNLRDVAWGPSHVKDAAALSPKVPHFFSRIGVATAYSDLSSSSIGSQRHPSRGLSSACASPALVSSPRCSPPPSPCSFAAATSPPPAPAATADSSALPVPGHSAPPAPRAALLPTNGEVSAVACARQFSSPFAAPPRPSGLHALQPSELAGDLESRPAPDYSRRPPQKNGDRRASARTAVSGRHAESVAFASQAADAADSTTETTETTETESLRGISRGRDSERLATGRGGSEGDLKTRSQLSEWGGGKGVEASPFENQEKRGKPRREQDAYDFILALWEIHKRMVEHGLQDRLETPFCEGSPSEEREDGLEASSRDRAPSEFKSVRRFVAVKAESAAAFPADPGAADRLIDEAKRRILASRQAQAETARSEDATLREAANDERGNPTESGESVREECSQNGKEAERDDPTEEAKQACPSAPLRNVVPGEKYNMKLEEVLSILFVDLDNPKNPFFRSMEAQQASIGPPFPSWMPRLPLAARVSGASRERSDGATQDSEVGDRAEARAERQEEASWQADILELAKRRPSRELAYEMSLPVTTLNRLLGLPSRGNIEERHAVFMVSEACVVIEKDAYLHGLPLSDCFFTRVRYRLTALNAAARLSFFGGPLKDSERANGEREEEPAARDAALETPETQLDFEYEVVFVKSTFLQGKITSQGEAQVADTLAQFLQFSREALQAAVEADAAKASLALPGEPTEDARDASGGRSLRVLQSAAAVAVSAGGTAGAVRDGRAGRLPSSLVSAFSSPLRSLLASPSLVRAREQGSARWEEFMHLCRTLLSLSSLLAFAAKLLPSTPFEGLLLLLVCALYWRVAALENCLRDAEELSFPSADRNSLQ